MGLFRKKHKAEASAKAPRHIGIIMDGNGRWATRRGLPRFMGHAQGGKTFRTIVRHCNARGVEYVTFYAFSTENWNRPKEEVDSLMRQFEEYLDEILVDFEKYNMKLKFIGDISALSENIVKKMAKAALLTEHMTGITVNLAINYGGRQEIVRAAGDFAMDCLLKGRVPETFDEQAFSQYLYTAGQPDPDLIIRPSGEQRLSNFLLWQSAYAEFWYSDVLWPDFKPADLDRAIADYNRRSRRFGGV